jgi:hypothetical protein
MLGQQVDRLDVASQAANLDSLLAGGGMGSPACLVAASIVGSASSPALEAMAEAELQKRDLTQASFQELTDLSREAMAQPWNADLRVRIAATWQRLGRPSLARMWLQAALACDPDHREAQRVLKELD